MAAKNKKIIKKNKTALGEGAVLINKKGAIYIFLFILPFYYIKYFLKMQVLLQK